MLTEDYITEVYCFIDDMMKECWKNIRKRGPGPKLSDAEVITMEIAGRVAGDGLRQNHSPLLSRPLAALVSEPWNSNHLFATGGQSLESQAGNSENSAHPSFAEWQPNQHC